MSTQFAFVPFLFRETAPTATIATITIVRKIAYCQRKRCPRRRRDEPMSMPMLLPCEVNAGCNVTLCHANVMWMLACPSSASPQIVHLILSK